MPVVLAIARAAPAWNMLGSNMPTPKLRPGDHQNRIGLKLKELGGRPDEAVDAIAMAESD
ncbi:hypothetical protein ACQEXF_61270 [Streptomyces sp. CA-106131]